MIRNRLLRNIKKFCIPKINQKSSQSTAKCFLIFLPFHFHVHGNFSAAKKETERKFYLKYYFDHVLKRWQGTHLECFLYVARKKCYHIIHLFNAISTYKYVITVFSLWQNFSFIFLFPFFSHWTMCKRRTWNYSLVWSISIR